MAERCACRGYVLAPGSFTGNKHLAAQTYDVTRYLRDSENELLVALGDGWHRSTGGVDGDRDLFGDTLGVLFQLEVDGKPVCVSDDTMQATQCGRSAKTICSRARSTMHDLRAN